MVVVVLGVSYSTRPSIRVVLPVVYLANPRSRTQVVEELDASKRSNTKGLGSWWSTKGGGRRSSSNVPALYSHDGHHGREEEGPWHETSSGHARAGRR